MRQRFSRCFLVTTTTAKCSFDFSLRFKRLKEREYHTLRKRFDIPLSLSWFDLETINDAVKNDTKLNSEIFDYIVGTAHQFLRDFKRSECEYLVFNSDSKTWAGVIVKTLIKRNLFEVVATHSYDNRHGQVTTLILKPMEQTK